MLEKRATFLNGRYEMLEKSGNVIKVVHWWRVVLDESQRVPKPRDQTSALAGIARSLCDLSRTHSWLMSGTPTEAVDDLLGQLIFLGVEPYCDRGARAGEGHKDSFWEREITRRWKEKDVEALEIVHDLLGQIMMRHSKAQTSGGAAIVELPPRHEELVRVPLACPSERAVCTRCHTHF